jgi:hypothetical protein
LSLTRQSSHRPLGVARCAERNRASTLATGPSHREHSAGPERPRPSTPSARPRGLESPDVAHLRHEIALRACDAFRRGSGH